MKKMLHNTLKILWLPFAAAVIIFIFSAKIENARSGRFTFQIKERGHELTIIDGLEHVGKKVNISDETVEFDSLVFKYTVEIMKLNDTESIGSVQPINPKGKTYNARFFWSDNLENEQLPLLEGGMFLEVNNLHVSGVEFQSRISTNSYHSGSGGNEAYGYESDAATQANYLRQYHNVLTNSLAVNLRTIELYKALRIYSVVFLPISLISYCFYLRPSYLHSFLKSKIKTAYFIKSHYENEIFKKIKFTCIAVVILSSLGLFLLIF
ncbi:MAG: hypothetical protein FWG90_14020 [Oscillospiraceae bacterium]|nr:hypothetical protein [Oscillospiraceae bacterium]